MVIAYRDYRGLAERFWVPKRDSEYYLGVGVVTMEVAAHEARWVERHLSLPTSHSCCELSVKITTLA